MDQHPLPAFHAESLRQSFARQVALARSRRVLDATLADRFNTLCQNPWPATVNLSIKRLGCAALGDNPEFADALLIADPEQAEVYLCLPLCAIERFSSRSSLDRALLRRYGTDESSDAFITTLVLSTSIFDYWMNNLLSRQEGYLQALDTDLLALPTLQSVLLDTLQGELQRMAPEHPSAPEQWLYHAVRPQTPQRVAYTRTLLEVAIEEFCGVVTTDDTELRLVAPLGHTLSAENRSRFQAAFSSAIARLGGPYSTALTHYWQADTKPGTPRKQHAAAALMHRYYLALLNARELPDADAQWLRKALRTDLGAANGLLGVYSVALHSGQRAAIPLAAMLVLSNTRPATGPLFLFTARRGLVRFDSLQALTAWLTASAQQSLLHDAIGQDNIAPFQLFKNPEARLSAINVAPFAECADSVLEVQRKNLFMAIAKRGKVLDGVGVVLDDAIDVRALLAPSLLLLDQSTRWSVGEPAAPSTVGSQSVLPTTAYGRALDLQARFALLQDAVPSLESCLRHLLDLRLALLDDPHLNATSVWAHRTLATGEATRDTLLLVALEHLGQPAPAPLSDDAMITGVDGEPLPHLDPLLLNRWIAAVAQQVKGHWIAAFHRFNQQPTRLGAYQIDAHQQSLFIRQHALREELALEDQSPANDLWGLQWLSQVLDRPLRAMRMSFNDDMVECNQLAVQVPGTAFTIPFSNVLALTRIVEPQGMVLFCSHRLGLMSFDDHAALAEEINRLLDGPAGREQWLNLFAERYRPLLRGHLESEGHAPLIITLTPTEHGYAQVMQQGEETRQILTGEAAYTRARKGDYPPALWLAYVDDIASGLRLGDQLDELALTLKGELLDQTLPAWLRQATLSDLELYETNLERLRMALDMPQRFLFGVETATEFATQHVEAALALDFPQSSVDLNNVRVRVREKFKTGLSFSGATEGMVAGGDGVAFPTLELSLVQYTLHRFMAQPGLPLEVRMADGSALVEGLSPAYIANMASRLDTGGHYLRHLHELFSVQHEDYPTRLSLFRQQIPPALMDVAIEAKLRGTLSAAAYEVIATLVDMPDPTARQMPQGRNYYLRPLCLLADEGLDADPVGGLYLLGSVAGGEGPLVLLATFHEGFVYREYTSESHFLETMRKPGELQDLILQRVAPTVHSRYAHGGLLTPNFEVSAGPEFEQPEPRRRHTQLGFEPVTGNTMDFLLEHSLAFLLRTARTQVVTSPQADQAANLRLLQLLVETGLSLFSGRLALAVCAWQGEQWLESSAASAAQQEWGEAISKFIAALSTVLSHRRPRRERLEAARPAPATGPATPVFSWRAGSIPLALQAVLRGFEARDIKLANLNRDASTGLYSAADQPRRYAPVGGHVYQLEQRGEQWHIVENGRQGPDVRRNAAGHWELDLQWGLRGGGGGWSRQRAERRLQHNIAQDFITEAVGMPAIRQLALDKALKIGAARLHAKDYLERSLDALSPPPGQNDLTLPVQNTLEQFFDVSAPSAQLIGAIKRQVGQIFGELMDASMNLHSSERYVIGRNRPGREGVLAFVDPKDPQRRLFLTGTFFALPEQMRAMLRSSQRSFEAADHFRATTLIHELSHLANLTVDIAYVEASAPFLDLIDSTTPGLRTQSLLHDLTIYQQQALTAKTPPGQLFKIRENGVWRDIDAGDGDGYRQVLRITGEHTLAAARSKFLNDATVRSQVMLANADSVALLITLLARHPLARSVAG